MIFGKSSSILLFLLVFLVSNAHSQQTLVPDTLDNRYTYNTSAHQQSNMVTAYDGQTNTWWQYFVYWDSDRKAKITRRNFLQEGSWSNPVNIHSAIGGDTLSNDSHNTIAVGVGPDGILHVSGNHHVDPLNYARSTQPHNMNSFQNVRSMIPSDANGSEQRVTYPAFFNSVDGDLFFFYRDHHGRSFSSYLNKWDPTTKRWNRLHQIATGVKIRFYPQRIVVDHSNGPNRGRIHIMAMWRDDNLDIDPVKRNEDIFHLYSDDEEVTWKQLGSNNSLNLPLQIGQPQLIIDTGRGSASRNLLNQSGLEIDASGNPHGVISMASANGQSSRHYHHIWHDGSRWNVRQLNNQKPGNRPAVITTPSGGVYMMNARSNSMTLLNITPGSSKYDKETITLSNGLSNTHTAANYDATAFYIHNKLSFLASPAQHNGQTLNARATIVTRDLASFGNSGGPEIAVTIPPPAPQPATSVTQTETSQQTGSAQLTEASNNPTPQNTSEECAATGFNIIRAMLSFKSTCGQSYSRSKGHDIDFIEGRWVFATARIASNIRSLSQVPGLNNPVQN